MKAKQTKAYIDKLALAVLGKQYAVFDEALQHGFGIVLASWINKYSI
ncbi:hypothetical protein [Alcaligenes nematophilus]